MFHLGMVSPSPAATPKKPSMRQRIRTLEQVVAMYERGNTSQQEAMDKMAENMTHLILRLEGLRAKFQLSVDEVNQIGEEYLAKVSANQEMQKASAANIKVLEVNGVTYKPATAPEVAPLSPPSNSKEPSVEPISTAPAESQPAHCATGGASSESSEEAHP